MEELRLLLIEQPARAYGRPSVFFPRKPGDLCVPWEQEPRTGLTLPLSVILDREWEEQWPARVMLAPGRAGLPGTAADMAHVAWSVLRVIDPDQLVPLLAALVFRLEILGPFSPFAVDVRRQLNLPPAPRIKVEVESGISPLFDPRCLRWVIQEIAAATAAGGWGPGVEVPEPDDHPTCELLGRVLFSTPVNVVSDRSSAEVLRAVWLLHEGFSQGGQGGSTLHDRVLSVAGVLGYSQRPRFAWADRFNQWRKVWETDDQHPAIAGNPSATGQRHRPSHLRSLLAEKTGLSVADLMTGGLGLAAWYFVQVAQGEPHLGAPDDIRSLVTTRGPMARRFTDTLQQHLATTLLSLGGRLLQETSAQGRPYRGLGSTPTNDTRALADTPLLVVDGAWAPLGLDLLVDRIVDFPRALAVSDGRFGNNRSVNGLVGYMFEAVITDLMQRLRFRHHVLTEAEVVSALGARDGGDGLIGYDGRYLVVEASVQTLGPHIAQGSVDAIRRRCKAYHEKANQAVKTAGDIHRLTSYFGMRMPEATTFIVVTDIPMSLNPVVANELRAQKPDRNPKFVCSLEEFERLVELGVAGWDVPRAVVNWQARPLDVTLTAQLAQMADLAGEDGRRWRFDLQSWLDSIPVDEPEAA